MASAKQSTRHTGRSGLESMRWQERHRLDRDGDPVRCHGSGIESEDRKLINHEARMEQQSGAQSRSTEPEPELSRKEELEDAQWYSPPNLPQLPSPASIARRLIDGFLRERLLPS